MELYDLSDFGEVVDFDILGRREDFESGDFVFSVGLISYSIGDLEESRSFSYDLDNCLSSVDVFEESRSTMDELRDA